MERGDEKVIREIKKERDRKREENKYRKWYMYLKEIKMAFLLSSSYYFSYTTFRIFHFFPIVFHFFHFFFVVKTKGTDYKKVI